MIRPLGVPVEPVPAVRPSATDSMRREVARTSLRLPVRLYLSPLDPPDDDDTHGAPDPACLPDVCECDDGLVRVDTWLGFPVYLDCSCPLARPVRDDSLPFDV